MHKHFVIKEFFVFLTVLNGTFLHSEHIPEVPAQWWLSSELRSVRLVGWTDRGNQISPLVRSFAAFYIDRLDV